MMLEPDPSDAPGLAARATRALQAAGIETRPTNPAFALTHAKYALVDGTQVLILTFNVLAASGAEGLTQFCRQHPDLMLLDIQLSDRNGLDLCRELRAKAAAPVIIMSVLTDNETRARAAACGAADYLAKPFALDELVQRIESALQSVRGDNPACLTLIKAGDLRIDLVRAEVHLRNQRVELEPVEYLLLRCLAVQGGRLVSAQALLEAAWGDQAEQHHPYLHTHIRQLLCKIEPDPAHPIYLLTEPGVGYRLAASDSAPSAA